MHGQTDQILHEKAPVRELRVRAVDADDLVLERHGGIHVLDALQLRDQLRFVHARAQHLHGLLVDIKNTKPFEKIRAVGPRRDAHFTAHTMGVHDLPGFQKFLCHKFSLYAKAPATLRLQEKTESAGQIEALR